MSDPLTLRGIELLTRGHNLYAGEQTAAEPADVPQRLRAAVDRLTSMAVRGGTGAAAADTDGLVAALRHTATLDTELTELLAGARTDRRQGRHATRAILDDALAEANPAVDTALGRREALRRMTSRLQTQQRHIRRSRRRSGMLTRRMRQLTYPRRRHAPSLRPRVAAYAIPLHAVRYDRPAAPGGVNARICRALDHLAIADPVARHNWRRGYETLIARESGGRAAAVAAEPATTPGPAQPDGHGLGYARGITQTIPATFAQYHQPGTSTNIYDPVANICASMNYVMHRYGVDADGANLVASVQQADRDRAPKGY